MQGLGLLLLLVVLFWLWYSSVRARETALQYVLKKLRESDLQLLDGSIYLKKIWPTRLQNGVIGLLRFYYFEYTANGIVRYQGLVVTIANKLEYLQIEKDGHTVVVTETDTHKD